jgi:chitinase
VARSESCSRPGVEAQTLDPNQSAPERTQVEHTIPLVIIPRFASVAQHGRMWDARPVGYVNLETGEEHGRAHPLGRLTNTPAVGNEEFWRNV